MPHSPLPWHYKYDNDTGPDDDGYWEWYDIFNANGLRVGRIDDEEDAAFICALVNEKKEG